MEQAKARNPNIKLYALAWTAPGWTASFLSKATIGYVVQWLACARQHGLRIDYVGGRSEREELCEGMDGEPADGARPAGFSGTQIAMPDPFEPGGKWPVATDVAGDPKFRAAISILAEHDVCGDPTNGNQCTSTPTARRLRKPLWASELGKMDGNAGAPSRARSEIRGTWPMIAAMPPGLPHENLGLIKADQPLSGHYAVNAMTYAIAMMTWFTAPGWHYVDGANGGPGGLTGVYANGSYSTLKAPNSRDWSTIAETTTTTAEQHVNFIISGGLAAGTIHVWRTQLSSRNTADWMVKRTDIHPVGGKFSFGLLPPYVYSFTTLAAPEKGSSTAPPPRPLRSYTDDPTANPWTNLLSTSRPWTAPSSTGPALTTPARHAPTLRSGHAPSVAARRHERVVHAQGRAGGAASECLQATSSSAAS